MSRYSRIPRPKVLLATLAAVALALATLAPALADLHDQPLEPVCDFDDTDTVRELAEEADQEEGEALLCLQPPGPPEGLDAEAGDRQVTLTWDEPEHDGGSEITDYKIEATDKATSQTIHTNTEREDGLSRSNDRYTYTVPGLENGTNYAFAVSAINDVGEGPAATEDEIPAGDENGGTGPVPGEITGTVIDDDTKAGIEGANVATDCGTGGSHLGTNAEGEYTISITDLDGATSCKVTASAGGYQSQAATVPMTGDDNGKAGERDFALNKLSDQGGTGGGTGSGSGSDAPDPQPPPPPPAAQSDGESEPVEEDTGGERQRDDARADTAEEASTASRISGTDRVSTAAAVSASTFSPGAPVVFVATAAGFADALAGGPAAAALGGPVLLAGESGLPDATRAEIERLGPARAVVLGGTGALPREVEAQIAALGPDVERLSGPDRFATAAAVSAATFEPGVAEVFVATGGGFADALSGGAAAAARSGPVLLVTPDELPEATATELSRLEPGAITILGGAQAVSEVVAAQLQLHTPGQVTRVSGSDRYATSAAVAAHTFGSTVTVAYVATGENYPDALAGVPAAGARRAPLLLVQRDAVPEPIVAQLERLRPEGIVILGGAGAVSDAVAAQLESLTR